MVGLAAICHMCFSAFICVNDGFSEFLDPKDLVIATKNHKSLSTVGCIVKIGVDGGHFEKMLPFLCAAYFQGCSPTSCSGRSSDHVDINHVRLTQNTGFGPLNLLLFL